MSKIIVFLLLFFSCWMKPFAHSYPEPDFDDIPLFKILLSNGRYFSATNLPKDKPVIIIYFSPDCGHCQTLMNALFKKIKELKNAEIVMVTSRPIEEVTDFERSYQTFNYPNIIVGTEGTTFFLRNYYKIVNTPFTVLYDKHGNLIYSYRKETLVDDLINRVKQLK